MQQNPETWRRRRVPACRSSHPVRERALRGALPAAIPAAVLGALLLLVLLAPSAVAHTGDPSFRSEVKHVRPEVPGLAIEVLNYDDRLLLTNRTGRTVLVRGYEGEPYVRIRAAGIVEVNKRAPTFYLNEDRYAQVNVPSQASERASPLWETVGKNGRYEWHDHRIHWMSKDRPPKVKDEDKPAKILDWSVPIVVGSKPARIAGALRWEPADSGIPPAALIALGGLAAASLLLFLVSRRLRTRNLEQRGSAAW
jgi:hypothetical protein